MCSYIYLFYQIQPPLRAIVSWFQVNSAKVYCKNIYFLDRFSTQHNTSLQDCADTRYDFSCKDAKPRLHRVTTRSTLHATSISIFLSHMRIQFEYLHISHQVYFVKGLLDSVCKRNISRHQVKYLEFIIEKDYGK